MSLPQQQPWQMAQTTWATLLNPILANPVNNALILKKVSLVEGKNVINHMLQAPLQGWFTTRVRASATFYDLQDANQTPQLTLVLMASAPAIIDLVVF